MSQRILTGISAVMAVCSLAVVGIAWMLMKDSQGVNQKMLEQLAVIADRPQADSTVVQSLQKTNEAIVRELRILSESQPRSLTMDEMGMSANETMGSGMGMEAKPAAPANVNQQILKQLEQLNQKQTVGAGSSPEGMNQISFQLVQDNKGQKPAVDFKGTLTKSGNQTESFSLDAVSNAAGTLDFGNLPWGRYQLNLKAPWGESFQKYVTVIPGRDYSQTIICPAAAPEEVLVQFQVDWPGDSNVEDWVLICDFRSLSGGKHQLESSRLIADQNWVYKQSQQDHFNGVYLINNHNLITACPLSREGEYEDIDSKKMVEMSSIKMSQGKYVLPDLILVQNKDLQRLTELNAKQNYRVLNKNRTRSSYYHLKYRTLHGPTDGFSRDEMNTFLLIPFPRSPTDPPKEDPMILLQPPQTVNGLELSKRLAFTAYQSEENLWKIKLPDMENLKIPQKVEGAGQGFF